MFFKGKKDYKKKFARGNRVHVGLANFDFFLVHFIFTVKTEWSTRALSWKKHLTHATGFLFLLTGKGKKIIKGAICRK